MRDKLCASCGHRLSDHDGLEKCQVTIEIGKAFYECVCNMFIPEEGE